VNVCITSTGNDLSVPLDPRFGRCRFFLFVDTETGSCEAIENPAQMAGGGAGTKAAQLVAAKNVSAVLTGNVGPNAFSALEAAGIQIYTGQSGTGQEALERFKKGDLQSTTAPSAERHAGMGGGRRQR